MQNVKTFEGNEKVDANDFVSQIPPEEALAAIRKTAGEKLQERDQELLGAKTQTIKELLSVDTDNDPNCLVGDRWLCKGGSFVLVGQAGVGKSTLIMQQAITWSLGWNFFGSKAVRPLRSLIIQAENDIGDLAEQTKGVVNGMKLGPKEISQANKMVEIFTESRRTGEDLMELVEILVRQRRPDIVYLDPFLAYLGGDISDQQTCSNFLRNLATPLAQKYGFAWALGHHTPKPPKDPKLRKVLLVNDLSYMGMGSSEITNWARGFIILLEITDGIYELIAAKRGKRMGLMDISQKKVVRIGLKHSDKGLCWEQINMEEVQDAKYSTEMDDETFFAFLSTVAAKSSTSIALEMKATGVCSSRDVGKERIKSLLSRHSERMERDLLSIEPSDGWIDCGDFFVESRSGGRQFKLKVGKK